MKTLNMKSLMVALVAVMLASVFALPGVAQAQEDSDPTVEGRGWLYARGTGDVDIDMAGRFRAHLDGDITVTDHAGDMKVRFRGASDASEQERSSNVILDDFRGTIYVQGSDFSVRIDGQVVLQAHGKGEAYLVGEGIYKTRRGDRTVWDGMVRIGDPQVQPAA